MTVPLTVSLLDPDGRRYEVPGDTEAVDGDALAAATGWVLKPEGLCRGEVCVPLLGRPVRRADGRIDLAEWAAALGLALAVDGSVGAVALAHGADAPTARVGDPAPDLDLPDVDGTVRSFGDLAGRKRVLVTWASWCGCRHELAAWQAIQDELGPEGVSIYSVALDARPEDARPWVEAAAPEYPVVVDTAHVTADRYGITNVPSVVWVDEEGTVVKAPTIAPGDDQFRDFTRIDSATHHEALRRWVREGVLPAAADAAAPVRSPEEQQARAERRLAAVLHGDGHVEAAAAHLRRAVELAPWDWTIRRGGIALRGEDPFLGDEFLAFWEKWDAAGRPGYTPTFGVRGG